MPNLRRPRRILADILVRPPTRASGGAQTVNSLLGSRSLLSRRVPILRQFKSVINWGNPQEFQRGAHVRVLNPPPAVATAINKLLTLRALQGAGVRTPEFETDKTGLAGETWFVRGTLTGSAGAGISVVRKGGEFPAAPLYTKYVKKIDEVRIHVVGGKAIFVQFKKKEREAEQNDDQKLIRNRDNGWVFCPRDLADVSDDAKASAVAAVAALGLDFGAVDIVIGRDDKLAYVLEVNTAPGIESPTLQLAYRTALEEVFA